MVPELAEAPDTTPKPEPVTLRSEVSSDYSVWPHIEYFRRVLTAFPSKHDGIPTITLQALQHGEPSQRIILVESDVLRLQQLMQQMNPDYGELP